MHGHAWSSTRSLRYRGAPQVVAACVGLRYIVCVLHCVPCNSPDIDIMRYLRTLSNIALARTLAVTRGSFLASALRELSVALVQSQGYVYRYCVPLLAKASGRPMLPGADTPYLDCALWCMCGVCVLVVTGFFCQCCLCYFWTRCLRFLQPAFHPYISFCLLSAPVSIVTA
jgi:hypothetical protein